MLKELAARLERDISFKDALAEIKNQRLRMQNGSKRLVNSSKQRANTADIGNGDEDGGDAKGFTFNMGANDDDESDEGEDDSAGRKQANHESKWKPTIYKWKFERSR